MKNIIGLMLYLAPFIAWAQTPSQTDPCTQNETAVYVEEIRQFRGPLTGFLSNPDVSDQCKDDQFFKLRNNLKERRENGWCLDEEHCDNLQKSISALDIASAKIHDLVLEPDAAPQYKLAETCSEEEKKYLESSEEIWGEVEGGSHCPLPDQIINATNRADLALLKLIDQDIETIRQKIVRGLIPYCLLPVSCHQISEETTEFNKTSCAQDLIKKWILDPGRILDETIQETAIDTGGYIHLLLGQAFICPAGKQEGGTCGLYSGANLMAHYCSVPARNPYAQPGTCPGKGPGFTCVGPEELLQAYDEAGGWSAKLCRKNKTTGEIECKLAISNPLLAEQKAASAAYHATSSTSTFKPIKSQILWHRYKKLQRLAAQIYAIEVLNESPRKYRNHTLTGSPGVNLEKLQYAYTRYEFDPIHLSSQNDDSWNQIMETLSQYHPVQLGVNTWGWHDYEDAQTKQPKDGSHAVIAVGYWTAPNRENQILIMDSNSPDYIYIFPEPFLLRAFKANSNGALIICPPNDNRAICQNQDETP